MELIKLNPLLVELLAVTEPLERLAADNSQLLEDVAFGWGAEGFHCAGIPAERIGIALKAEDGARRAAEPALLAVLKHLGAIDTTEFSRLLNHTTPDILNTRNDVVGSVRATLAF